MDISEFVGKYHEQYPFDSGLGKTRRVSVAIDYPIVRKDNYRSGSAEHMLELLIPADDWDLHVDTIGDKGEVVGIEKDGVIVTGGMGAGILNIAVQRATSLWETDGKLKPAITALYALARGSNSMVLGYGAQPVCHAREWTHRGFYSALRKGLAEKFESHGREERSYSRADLLTLAASSRAYVEVGAEEFGKALTVLNAIEPFLTALFGNSPLCLGAHATGDGLVSRTVCFSGVPDGYRAFPGESIEDMEDYLRYMTRLDLLVAKSAVRYYDPDPKIPFAMFAQERPEEEVMENFFLQERMAQWSAVPDGNSGSIMVQACTQPHEDQLSFAAFALGIVENLDEVAALLGLPEKWIFYESIKEPARHYGLGDAWEKREDIPIRDVLGKIVGLSEQGLKRRGMSENFLLAPLRQRLDERKNPAEKTLSLYSELGSRGWIDLFQYLSAI